jgi:heme oxygenase
MTHVSIDDPRLTSLKPRVVKRTQKPAIELVHRALRTATRDSHASIDRMLLRFDLARSNDYQTFLTIHLDTLCALRGYWRAQDEADFQLLVDCISADLNSLGCTSIVSRIEAPTLIGSLAGLGISYFMRESRQLAAALRRGSVFTSPTASLDFAPTTPWTAFLLELEIIFDDATATQQAARAARGAYELLANQFASPRYALPPRPSRSNAGLAIASRRAAN